MSAALDLLTSHWERQRGRSFTVGLGAGQSLTVHHDPVTAREMQRVRDRAGPDDFRLALYVVIYLAKGPDGARLFEDNAATVKALTESVCADVLADMARRIMDTSDPAELGN
jgi:hypothetical protein